MPAYKPSTQFPGLDRLPAGIRGLVEGVFPQTPEMPTPTGMAAGPFRAAKDILNPQALAVMKRMGDEVKGMVQRGQVTMPTRGPDLRGFPSATPTPTGESLSEAALKALRYTNEFEPWAGVRKIKELIGK